MLEALLDLVVEGFLHYFMQPINRKFEAISSAAILLKLDKRGLNRNIRSRLRVATKTTAT